MSYDNEGRLSSWIAPGAAMISDQFLYDNAGNRVLQRVSNGSSSLTDTISIDGYTDVTINGGNIHHQVLHGGQQSGGDAQSRGFILSGPLAWAYTSNSMPIYLQR